MAISKVGLPFSNSEKKRAANLKKTDHGKDYYHFPEWLSSYFYAEIVAETRNDKGWENTNQARNESFDLLCYAKAGYMIKLLTYWKKEVNWDSPPAWAEEWDNNSEVTNKIDTTDQKKKTVKRTRVRMKVSR